MIGKPPQISLENLKFYFDAQCVDQDEIAPLGTRFHILNQIKEKMYLLSDENFKSFASAVDILLGKYMEEKRGQINSKKQSKEDQRSRQQLKI